MSRVKLLYLAPTADERDFQNAEVEVLNFDADVEVLGSLISFRDVKKNKTKRIPFHRIRQVDEFFDKFEQQKLLKKYRNEPKSEVYYWKVSIEEDNDWPYKVINIGHKPRGMDCVLEEITPFFIKILNPSFKSRIILPINCVAGLDTHE